MTPVTPLGKLTFIFGVLDIGWGLGKGAPAAVVFGVFWCLVAAWFMWSDAPVNYERAARRRSTSERRGDT